jgi:hypothetical protein
MRINGYWGRFPDGHTLPMFPIKVLRADGAWEELQFFLDTGAVRTVLCFEDFDRLGIEGAVADDLQFQGIGGRTPGRTLDTKFQFTRTDGLTVIQNGPFAALTDPRASDVSILGRDILYNFALLMDRPNKVLCLMHGAGEYQLK